MLNINKEEKKVILGCLHFISEARHKKNLILCTGACLCYTPSYLSKHPSKGSQHNLKINRFRFGKIHSIAVECCKNM